MTRSRRILPLALLLLLAMAASASARPVHLEPPARVQIGHAALGRTAGGDPSILVSVSYPIQLAGRTAPLEVTLLDRSGRQIFDRRVRVRLSAGELRRPEEHHAKRRVYHLPARVSLACSPR